MISRPSSTPDISTTLRHPPSRPLPHPPASTRYLPHQPAPWIGLLPTVAVSTGASVAPPAPPATLRLARRDLHHRFAAGKPKCRQHRAISVSSAISHASASCTSRHRGATPAAMGERHATRSLIPSITTALPGRQVTRRSISPPASPAGHCCRDRSRGSLPPCRSASSDRFNRIVSVLAPSPSRHVPPAPPPHANTVGSQGCVHPGNPRHDPVPNRSRQQHASTHSFENSTDPHPPPVSTPVIRRQPHSASGIKLPRRLVLECREMT